VHCRIRQSGATHPGQQAFASIFFAGTSTAVALLITAVVTRWWWLIAVGFVQGYAFAWVGHFFFEHNKPATFKYPWFSFHYGIAQTHR
jgi:hypothetical protein